MTALALSRAPVTEPVIKLAHALVAHLQAGEPIDQRLLRQLLQSACSQASTRDHRSIRHAYDALELAQILLLTSSAWSEHDNNLGTLAALAALVDRLPTQSIRTEEQLAFQQFSTPAAIAWLLGRAAALTSADTLLEPSAGTGMLAWPAARAGARLILNEIDPVRRLCLREAFGDAQVTGYDGELIDDLLPPDQRPTVVIMNPPFARSEGRGEDRHAADRHLLGAAKRLPHGGRIVALMPTWSSRDVLGSSWTCRMDLTLRRGLYAKHGTGIAVRLAVWDRVTGGGLPLVGDIGDLADTLRPVSYSPLRSHDTSQDRVSRLLLEKNNKD
ncbi:methylase, partial [Sphingomonas solaris]